MSKQREAMITDNNSVPREYYDQHPFRVWPDGTVQDCEENPHRWMSDDFVIVWAYDEAEALVVLASGGAIREALAEPEPEPVAWLSEGGDVSRSKRYMDEMGFICEPLYTAPPTRKPLTDEQIDQIIASNVAITDRNLYGAVYMIIREVEAAHGITDD